MIELTYTIYEDDLGPCFVCKNCMYHSRNKTDVLRKHCRVCLAYHTDDGRILMRNIPAERGYRAAWNQRCLAINDRARWVAERSMDGLQPFIGRNPNDPRYYWFVRSLPGFLEFWDGLRKHLGRELTRRYE